MIKDFASHKRISIKFAQDCHFQPIPGETLDDSGAGVNGRFVYKCRCEYCGKQYYWRQSLRMMRHYLKEHNGKL